MTTLDVLIARIRRDYLTQGRTEPLNRLKDQIDATTTTLAFRQSLNTLTDGSLLSIGLEDIYVWSADDATLTADVDRGHAGTTASAHTTAERVRVNPRWSDSTILRAINSELDNLHAQGLPRVGHTDLAYSAATVGYALDANADVVHNVQVQAYDGAEWPDVDGWAVEHNQDTTVFASGNAIFLRNGTLAGQTVRVTWFGPYTHLSALDDDVETVSGVASTAVDLLALGAAIGLLVGREVGRNFHETQGNTRRAEEVPPGAEAQAINPILRRYDDRLRNELARHATKYPPRTRR